MALLGGGGLYASSAVAAEGPTNKVRTAHVRINSGVQMVTHDFSSRLGRGHDRCFLVKAGGQIGYTGDETQGCNGD